MSNIADRLDVVTDRANRFFTPDQMRMQELHVDVFSKIGKVGKLFVIGGAIRDLAFFGAEERPISDIDIVVTGRPESLDRVAATMGAMRNRFGGYGLRSGGYKVDFWSLHNTWAKKAGYARVVRPVDLFRTTFFDWDTILYDVQGKRVLAPRTYLNRLISRRIEINLEENPSEMGSLIRAMRRLITYDAKPGPRLRRFMYRSFEKFRWSEILRVEAGAFHVSHLSQFRSTIDYCSSVMQHRTYDFIGTHSRRQLSLFDD